jgi:hypothetical protein
MLLAVSSVYARTCGAFHCTGDPMKSILDPSFRYTKSVETDLKKTFARIRREMRKQQQQPPMAGAEVVRKVLSFHSR